jgi:hypothetical protein
MAVNVARSGRDDLFDGLVLVGIENGIELWLGLCADVSDGFVGHPLEPSLVPLELD